MNLGRAFFKNNFKGDSLFSDAAIFKSQVVPIAWRNSSGPSRFQQHLYIYKAQIESVNPALPLLKYNEILFNKMINN